MSANGVSFEQGQVVFVDGYKGDRIPRFGQVRGSGIGARSGKQYVTLYRDKEGEREGAYRSYHIDGLVNARVPGLSVG